MKIQAVPIQAKEKQPHREGQSCQNIQRDSVRLSFAFGCYKTKSFPSILPRAPDGRDTAGRPWQGQDLHLKTLSLDGGQVAVDGTVTALIYEEPRREGGFFSRLFG